MSDNGVLRMLLRKLALARRRPTENGDRLRGYIDNVLIFDVTENQPSVAGYAGFGIYSSHQNNRIETVTASTKGYPSLPATVSYPSIANVADDITISGTFQTLTGDVDVQVYF